jgi:carboxymethylenebutenolidase
MSRSGSELRSNVVRSGDVPLSVTCPARSTNRGIVLLQEIWGVSRPLLQAADRLTAAGYLVAVPHLYHRAIDVGAVIGEDDYPAAAALRAGLRRDALRADLSVATGWLREHGVRRIGVLGYSMGGSLALWAATTLPVDAAVTFYGGGLTISPWSDIPAGIDCVRRLRIPWLGLYGGADPASSAEALSQLKVSASTAAATAVVVDFPGVDHGFALDPADPRHDPQAAEIAWHRANRFLVDMM